MYLTARKQSRPVGSKFQLVRRGSCADSLARGSGGMPPQDTFGHLRSFLVQFWSEIARFRQSAAIRLLTQLIRSKGVALLCRNCDFARMYIALVLNKNVNLNRAHYTTQRENSSPRPSIQTAVQESEMLSNCLVRARLSHGAS